MIGSEADTSGAARRVRVGRGRGPRLLGAIAVADALRLAEEPPRGARPGRPGGRGRPRVHEVGVLSRAAPCRRCRGAGRALRSRTSARRGAEARLHALERRVQPHAVGRHSVPPPRGAVPARALRRRPGRIRRSRDRGRARAWLSDSWDLVHPSGSGGVYANFPDPDLPDEHRAYWGCNLERVRRVKETYYPEGLFG